ncbi:VWA domain-containing protein [Candidatus Altiarchaeota archaeon]
MKTKSNSIVLLIVIGAILLCILLIAGLLLGLAYYSEAPDSKIIHSEENDTIPTILTTSTTSTTLLPGFCNDNDDCSEEIISYNCMENNVYWVKTYETCENFYCVKKSVKNLEDRCTLPYACVNGKNECQFIPPATTTFILLIDTSLSMSVEKNGNIGRNNKLYIAKELAKNLLEQIKNDQVNHEVAIITFNENPQFSFHRSQLKQNYNACIDVIENLEGNKTTRIVDSFELAKDVLKVESNKKAIILISDGLFNRNDMRDINGTLNVLNLMDVKIYALSVGLDTYDKHLITITNTTKGITFPYPKDSKEIYQKILETTSY